MLSLIVVAMVTVAVGFVVWANDKRHAKYGISLPAGVALGAGMLSWTIFLAAGFGYPPGQLSTRALGMGGALAEFDAQSVVNPQAVGAWGPAGRLPRR